MRAFDLLDPLGAVPGEPRAAHRGLGGDYGRGCAIRVDVLAALNADHFGVRLGAGVDFVETVRCAGSPSRDHWSSAGPRQFRPGDGKLQPFSAPPGWRVGTTLSVR